MRGVFGFQKMRAEIGVVRCLCHTVPLRRWTWRGCLFARSVDGVDGVSLPVATFDRAVWPVIPNKHQKNLRCTHRLLIFVNSPSNCIYNPTFSVVNTYPDSPAMRNPHSHPQTQQSETPAVHKTHNSELITNRLDLDQSHPRRRVWELVGGRFRGLALFSARV